MFGFIIAILVGFLIVLAVEELKKMEEQTKAETTPQKEEQRDPPIHIVTSKEEIEQQRKLHLKYGFDFVGPENVSLSMLETILKNERAWRDNLQKEAERKKRESAEAERRYAEEDRRKK